MKKKFGKLAEVFVANNKALIAGYNYADTVEVFTGRFTVRKAKLDPGTYRMLMGNQATVLGFVAAAQLAQRQLFYGSYPITPASSILEGLSNFKHFGVKTFQAEDEISAVGSAIGASFGGAIGLTGTSGPGVALKAEAIGLAVMTELPLIVINVQRGGPSTGLPTKTEQADLLQAMFGRNGECPVAIVAPQSPTDCFYMAIEATRIAVKYMVPVIYLSDGYLANGAEPWNIPLKEDLPDISVNNAVDPEGFLPYQRDPETLARPWAVPGTPGLEHRLGGIEKEENTGNVSYDPDNHQKMVLLRAEKVARIAQSIPELEVHGDPEGDLLVLGWGSTYGSITSAVNRVRDRGGRVSSAHLRYLNPFPANIEEVLGEFKKILIPELNMGQLLLLIRARFCIDAEGLNKVQGQPFQIGEIEQKIEEML
jgi:2-oxoglutarate ferredoxin oxidoreductase subunit alpha